MAFSTLVSNPNIHPSTNRRRRSKEGTNMTKTEKLLVGLFAVNSVVVVTQVEKERPKITPGLAAAVVVTNAALIWATVRNGRSHG